MPHKHKIRVNPVQDFQNRIILSRVSIRLWLEGMATFNSALHSSRALSQWHFSLRHCLREDKMKIFTLFLVTLGKFLFLSSWYLNMLLILLITCVDLNKLEQCYDYDYYVMIIITLLRHPPGRPVQKYDSVTFTLTCLLIGSLINKSAD